MKNSACFCCGGLIDCEEAFHLPPYDHCFCEACYIEVAQDLDGPRDCKFCGTKTPAVALAAQSFDCGVTITWAFACDYHLEGWNAEIEWEAPIIHLIPAPRS